MPPEEAKRRAMIKKVKKALGSFHYGVGHEGKWQECLKCKNEFFRADNGEFTNEECNVKNLEDDPKITCVSCGFKSESKEDFASELNEDYYCTKDECLKKDKLCPGENSKRKTELERNHTRFTLYVLHYTQGHEGKLQECAKCKNDSTKIDFEELANNSSKSEKINFSKISCFVCGFQSESEEGFAFKLNGQYYCINNECQKMGMPSALESIKKNAEVMKSCGLCGKNSNLTKTKCCDNWICDDEHNYILNSFARNSCYRNHRYSLCSFHHCVGHEGKWQECLECKDIFSEFDYKELANEYRLETLEEALKIMCAGCGFRAVSNESFAFKFSDNYYCAKKECQEMAKLFPTKSTKQKNEVKNVKAAEVENVKSAEVKNIKSAEVKNVKSAEVKNGKAAEVKNVKAAEIKSVIKACGLCKKTDKLTKTGCCDNWICDDEHKYDLHSLAGSSCFRNHLRYSLCSFHHCLEHKGKWQECQECIEILSEADYAKLTSKYNLENSETDYTKLATKYKLENFKNASKITCVSCGFKSKSKEGFAFKFNNNYYCTKNECQRMAKLPSPKSTKVRVGVKGI